MRAVQPEGQRGSLRWIQHCVEHVPDVLRPAGLPELEWVSPLRSDDFAEYRDTAFLKRLGLERLSDDLRKFWPRGGPQWDALALHGDGVVLVEAKAHLREFFSPGTQASPKSRALIARALDEVKSDLGAKDVSDWSQLFYQYTNRLAHLWWLRDRGVDARLLFVSFVGDTDMEGPLGSGEWDAAFATAEHALGLSQRHKLSRYIHHVNPDVREL